MDNQITTNNIDRQIKKLEGNLSAEQQIILIEQLCAEGEIGEKSLINYLINRRIINKQKIHLLDGLIFEKLYNTKNHEIMIQLNQNFKQGIIQLSNTLTFNYQPLQELLIKQNFQEADKLTQQYLCKLAGLDTDKTRTWLYFTDISIIPSEDLLSLDLLWQTYSRGKFGFSVQRRIWITHQCKWNIFWQTIGWTKQNIPCRYPKEFIWTLDAPKGHLPLFNQLRGVQVLSALFNHIVWQ
uniref:GUN4-like domain-containing protein n=1 Tax=Campylaephora sungminbooi TaxID=1896769 RepID=A0A1B0TI06_9FLOR|nr:hypothetical protein BI106_gp180 [Campylaephora sungminbooi]AKU47347.1 hypothetical protein [Campylaephora sungminbooi]ALN11794.1 hypothetical protein 238 [Campylaephora sungminbooi]